MRILLVNDDGINAKGLCVLAQVLALKHDVYVVAPAKEQSGMSQALTMGIPLRVQNIDMQINNVIAYSVEGTPADCTKLALEFLLKEKPDLIISGINNGANLGTDVLYSGTVGVALEGYNHQIPSIAISVSNKASIDFMQIAQIIADNIERLYQSDNLFMYNINFPDEFKDNKIKFVWTKHGRRIYENEFDKVILEDGSTAYKMQGRAKDIGNDECTDIKVVKKGYISITPLQLERTNWQQLTKLQNLGGFFMESMIRDIKLAPTGHDKIAWVKNFMPVLRSLDEEYSKTKPFAGKKVIITMHLEAKTAYLALVFKNAGAEVIATGSNPLSTQDDVVGALVEDGVTVYSWYNCTNEEYDMFIDKALDCNPDMIIDDGGDLVARIHNERPELIDKIIGGSEETTTGVIRLKALAEQGKLKFPMIAANDAYCKFLFDNRYGTGQSTWDGIMRTTNLVIAGKTVVIAGYGWCGKGGAMRAKGLGANVVITEVDPIKAIEAVFDGFRVMPMEEGLLK